MKERDFKIGDLVKLNENRLRYSRGDNKKLLQYCHDNVGVVHFIGRDVNYLCVEYDFKNFEAYEYISSYKLVRKLNAGTDRYFITESASNFDKFDYLDIM